MIYNIVSHFIIQYLNNKNMDTFLRISINNNIENIYNHIFDIISHKKLYEINNHEVILNLNDAKYLFKLEGGNGKLSRCHFLYNYPYTIKKFRIFRWIVRAFMNITYSGIHDNVIHDNILSNEFVDGMCEAGRLNILKWIYKMYGYFYFNICAINSAAIGGNLHILKWLKNTVCIDTSNGNENDVNSDVNVRNINRVNGYIEYSDNGFETIDAINWAAEHDSFHDI